MEGGQGHCVAEFDYVGWRGGDGFFSFFLFGGGGTQEYMKREVISYIIDKFLQGNRPINKPKKTPFFRKVIFF